MSTTRQNAGPRPMLVPFSATVYTGPPVLCEGVEGASIIDLDGLELSELPVMPLFFQHVKRRGRIGRVDRVWIEDGEVRAEGHLDSRHPSAAWVVNGWAKGLRWRTSIGAGVPDHGANLEHLGPGEVAIVNGRPVTGPLLIARRSIVRDVSVVDIPADPLATLNLLGHLDAGQPEAFEPWDRLSPDEARAIAGIFKARALASVASRSDRRKLWAHRLWCKREKEDGTMGSIFVDYRGESWELDVSEEAIASDRSIAETARWLRAIAVERPAELAELMARPDYLGTFAALLARDRDGRSGSVDPGLSDWIASDPAAQQRVSYALAEAIAEGSAYEPGVVAAAGWAFHVASGTSDEENPYQAVFDDDDDDDLAALGGAPPAEGLHLAAAGPVELRAAGEGGEGRPRLRLLAYTSGALMHVRGFRHPVVVDLDGVEAATPMPILRNHDHDRIVGQAEDVKIDAFGIHIEGTVTGEDDDAKAVLTHAKNGFTWRASIGASVPSDGQEMVASGQSATVNGVEVRGPATIARKTQLNEVSIVAIAADRRTVVNVAAVAAV